MCVYVCTVANYSNVLGAVRRINTELGIGARHITISTVGLVPRIERLANEDIQVRHVCMIVYVYKMYKIVILQSVLRAFLEIVIDLAICESNRECRFARLHTISGQTKAFISSQGIA